MVLRLDARLPILWRTPSSVQVGSDPAVAVLEDVGDGEARLLAALAAGVSKPGLAMLARSAGIGAEREAELLATLARALTPEPPLPPARVGVLGDSALAREVARLLSASGVLADPAEAGLVVLVGGWVIAPADHLRWLNRDVPHLPVTVSEAAVTVGPLVDPGLGPCLHCVHLARVDEDAAWPAVATQLLGRAAPEATPVLRAEVAAFVARRILERGDLPAGVSWRMDAEGSISARAWARHPGCRCAAPPGTDWAAVPPPAARGATTRATAVAAPA